MIVEDRTLLIPRGIVRQQLSVHIFALTVLFIIANNFPCVCVCMHGCGHLHRNMQGCVCKYAWVNVDVYAWVCVYTCCWCLTICMDLFKYFQLNHWVNPTSISRVQPTSHDLSSTRLIKLNQLNFNLKVWVLFSSQISQFKLFLLIYFALIIVRNVCANSYLYLCIIP